MPTPRKAGRFGGSAAHHKHIVANLATELLRHGRIQTTHAKAKTVQPTAERLITFAKRGDVHSRRQARKVVRDRDVLHHLFAEVGPAFADRDGGYTRVLKLGPRKGDAAPMALVELVDGVGTGPGAEEGEARRRWSLRRQRPEAAPSAPTTGEAAVSLEDAGDQGDEERPEVDPAEVEARFAAEEAGDEAGSGDADDDAADEAGGAGSGDADDDAADEADGDAADEADGDEATGDAEGTASATDEADGEEEDRG